MISNRWKILAAALPIIGMCAFGQPQPGGLGGFFSALWGVSRILDPYELLEPTAYWYPSEDLNNTDRILGIASTNTLNTATTTTNGWEFNGSSQYLDMGYPPEIEIGNSLQYTMAAWILRESDLSLQGIMGKMVSGVNSDRWAMYMESASNIRIFYQEQASTFVTVFMPSSVTNAWYHVVSVLDRPSTVSLYVDGVLVSSAAFTSTNAITYDGAVTLPFRFGLIGSAFYFDGYIDRAAVWNGRALTSNEVYQLFEDTKEGRK